jgi:hypothetical protein
MVRMQYSLARELKMTRAELVRSMSVREFIDWIAYFRLEQEDIRRRNEQAEDQRQAQEALRSMGGRF